VKAAVAFSKCLQTASTKHGDHHRRKCEDVCWKWMMEDDALPLVEFSENWHYGCRVMSVLEGK